MPRIDYDRYELYRNNDNTINQLPFVSIPISRSDKYEPWRYDSRMEKLATRFYDNPFFDFLIMYANPEYISEFDIPEGTIIRIPFPLDNAKFEYERGLKLIKDR